MIYSLIVQAKLRRVFRALNQGDYRLILASFGPGAEHSFFGQHALGGLRHGMDGIRPWYARLKQVFPDLHFDLDAMAVSGPPWNTVAMVEWRDSFTLRDGQPRGNQGVHVLRLRWGKVVSLHVHCDTQKLADVLHDLQAQGVPEAALPPIGEPA